MRPDADKRFAFAREIAHGGPAALRVPFDAARLAALARGLGVACSPSRDAGDFICNETLYLSLLMDRRAAFIHLPDWRGASLAGALKAIGAMALELTRVRYATS